MTLALVLALELENRVYTGSVETLGGALSWQGKEKSMKKTEKGEASGVGMWDSMGTWFHRGRKRRVAYLSQD